MKSGFYMKAYKTNSKVMSKTKASS